MSISGIAGSNMSVGPQDAAGEALDWSRRHVNVLAVRSGFIEFEFVLADPMLTVELIMPPAAFDEFCIAQNATVTVAAAAALDYGLLRARLAR